VQLGFFFFLNLSLLPVIGGALKLFFPAVSVVTQNRLLELETRFKYMHIENSMYGIPANWLVGVRVSHNT
jgi:hypothetical protein